MAHRFTIGGQCVAAVELKRPHAGSIVDGRRDQAAVERMFRSAEKFERRDTGAAPGTAVAIIQSGRRSLSSSASVAWQERDLPLHHEPEAIGLVLTAWLQPLLQAAFGIQPIGPPKILPLRLDEVDAAKKRSMALWSSRGRGHGANFRQAGQRRADFSTLSRCKPFS